MTLLDCDRCHLAVTLEELTVVPIRLRGPNEWAGALICSGCRLSLEDLGNGRVGEATCLGDGAES